MAAKYPNTKTSVIGAAPNGDGRGSGHTLTSLNRWSILNKQLPAVESIKTIHVYDFDNTLFKTPTPNKNLWVSATQARLMCPDFFVNGGWWHDARILAATGDGLEQEEAKAWEGWWNEHVVGLARLSSAQPDVLNVLLTGRAERCFSDLIKRMVASKGLQFDMISLKPVVGPNQEHITSTLKYKQTFLAALMETYGNAREIRIYEDRYGHVQQFRTFMCDYNRGQASRAIGAKTRSFIAYKVIHIAELSTTLDPVTEVAEIQQMINSHNALLPDGSRDRLSINKSVFFTGYVIKPADTRSLLSLAPIPDSIPSRQLTLRARTILICQGRCPPNLLQQVGGIGAKMKWEVTGIGCHEDRIWAASVRPVPADAAYHPADQNTPHVILAMRGNTREGEVSLIQNWRPVPEDKKLVLETTVEEKVALRVEADDDDGVLGALNPGAKRKQGPEEESRRQRGGYQSNWFYDSGPPRGRGDGDRGRSGAANGSAFRGQDQSGRRMYNSGPTRPNARGRGRAGGNRGGRGNQGKSSHDARSHSAFSSPLPPGGRPSGQGPGHGPDLQKFY